MIYLFKKKLYFLLSITYIIFWHNGIAQNLIPNPGFDELNSGKHSMYPWTKINTIDFFLENNKLSTYKTSKIDKNFILRKARSSPAYIGIRVQNNYREFIQIKLNQPLIKGQNYRFELYMVQSEHCKYLIRSLGVSFNERKNAYSSNNIVKKFQPQILFSNKKGLKSDNNDWKLYSAEYIAQGNEQFVTIGNFSVKQSKRLVPKKFKLIPPKTKEAYIYLDDISLIDLDTTIDNKIFVETLNFSDSIKIEKNYVTKILTDSNNIILHNIFFDHNSANLLSESYDELQLLLEFMNENPDSKIEITGHTDNNGSISYNQRLSNLRAKAVYDFLVSNQISKNRLSYLGKGFSEPISDNNTIEGRKLNRRVEIRVK